MKSVTLFYWRDDGWYVRCIKERSDVFSQGETQEELEENIQDALQLMEETDYRSSSQYQIKEITF